MCTLTSQVAAHEDDEVSVEKTVLSLKCPIAGVRITLPARFTTVPGLACFDLDPFLAMAAQTRKWLCPNSMTHVGVSVQTLQIDAYTQRLLACLAGRPEVTEVEVDRNGRWRPVGAAADEAWHNALEEYSGQDLGGAGGPSGAGAAGAVLESESEEDEKEELRRAAAAVSAAPRQLDEPSSSDEVIVIDDD